VVSETNVIGRARGPILQKTGTTSTRKTVSIEVVVVPPTGIQECFISNVGCPLFTGGFIYQTIEKLIEGIKPFGIEAGTETIYNELFGSEFVSSKNRQGIVFKQSDNDSWKPTGGRYSRKVYWVYKQCSDNRYNLDHSYRLLLNSLHSLSAYPQFSLRCRPPFGIRPFAELGQFSHHL
jgi:hypothetical protein